MKQLTEYNRVSGYLNKIFSMLNETYFESAFSKYLYLLQRRHVLGICDAAATDDSYLDQFCHGSIPSFCFDIFQTL